MKIYNKLDLKYNGIPHLVIVNNKKVISDQVGAQDEAKTIEFLINAGIIEGETEDE